MALLAVWTENNISESVRAKAVEAAIDSKKVASSISSVFDSSTASDYNPSKKFLTIPVGDCRFDNPPEHLRFENKWNYYYQGQIDNCLLGCFVNAVDAWIGPQYAYKLLNTESNYRHSLVLGDIPSVCYSRQHGRKTV